jgi:CelD/BcsL family acetyltransferase involved in cellulose biosynthesis
VAFRPLGWINATIDLNSEIINMAISVHFDVSDDTLLDARGLDTPVLAAGNLPSNVEITIYEKLADIESSWRAFERHADCTVFQTFNWLATWQRHVGARSDVRPAIVVGRSDSGDILFMLPLATRPAGFARELVWLGSELCDYNAPLLATHFSLMPARWFSRLWEHVLTDLRDHARLNYHLIRLEKMPAMVGAQANPMLTLGVTLNPSGAYATELKESWEAFYAAKRSASTRSRDRTKRKRLTEFGELALVHAQSGSDILATLDTLVAQKSRAFARMGVSNIFERPGHLDFYRALMTDPQARSMVHVSRLDCGTQAAAVNLGLTFRGSYYHLQASHDEGDLSRFGPGAAHLHDLLRYAIECGFKIYDFTIGDERYKQEWCDGTQKLYDHMAFVTARGACIFAPMVVKHWLKRRIKQTPALWNAFSQARAFCGSLLRQ